MHVPQLILHVQHGELAAHAMHRRNTGYSLLLICSTVLLHNMWYDRPAAAGCKRQYTSVHTVLYVPSVLACQALWVVLQAPGVCRSFVAHALPNAGSR
jgi:hypothetical protein